MASDKKTREEILSRLSELDEGFTDKRRAFIRFYLRYWNASRAAKAAGVESKTGSLITQEQVGSLWLQEPTIREYISLTLALNHMDADEVLYRLALQARASFEDFFDLDLSGSPVLNLHKAEELGTLGLIKRLKPGRSGWEIELHDSQQALVQIGKFHALWSEKVIVEEDDNPDSSIERLEDRASRINALLDAARTRRDNPTLNNQ